MIDELAERAKSGEDRQALLDDILAIVIDVEIPDEQIGALIRGERIGWERVEAAAATGRSPAAPRPWALGDAGGCLSLPAAVHPGRAPGPRLLRWQQRPAADRGARDSAPAERDRGSQGPRRCPY